MMRDRFVIDDPSLVYLDGNSLGRLPMAAREAVRDAVERQWGQRLIRGWNESWLEVPRRIARRLSAILGVSEDEVALSDSTSVNLYKLAHGALALRPGRSTIVTDTENFPSDVYLLEGLARQTGRELRVVRPEEIEAALTEDVALVSLSHVRFRTGELLNMVGLTAAAHRVGAMMLWDLSHSVGAVPTPLRESGAELAVGCTYKHLNGGPGAPAFLFVRRDLQEAVANPIQGWFGQRNPFEFGLSYEPAAGIERYQVGTAPMLSVIGCEAGIALVEEVGISAIRARSLEQTQRLIDGLGDVPGSRILTPRDADRRGAHVTLGHPEAWRIVRCLIEDENIIPDFRAPDGIRLGPAPLYTTDEEMDRAIAAIHDIVRTERYLKFDANRPSVT